MSHVDAFQDGLLAAKAGKKMVARLQFEQVTEVQPDFVHGWLWLAWTADSPEQAEGYLAKAEKIDPDNRLVTTYKEVVTALALYETGDDFSTFLASEVAQQEDSSQQEESSTKEEEPQTDSEEATQSAECDIRDEVVAKSDDVTDTASDAENPGIAEQDTETVETVDAVEETVAEESTTEESVEDEKKVAEEVAEDDVAAKEAADEQSETKDFEEIRSEIEAAKKSQTETPEPADEAFDESTWQDDSKNEDPTKTKSDAGEVTVDATTVAAATTGAAVVGAAAVSSQAASEESRIAADVDELNEDVQAAVGINAEPEAKAVEPQASTSKKEEEAAPAAPAAQDVAQEVQGEVDLAPTILVVDDSPTVRKLVTMTLKSGGFAVETAEDGVEAMKMLVNLTPDLILLDVNMPRMDGYKLCKLIKRHEKTKFIPVVMLSGKDGMFDKLRGTLVGCNDYISKPFESADLLRHVEEYVYASAED